MDITKLSEEEIKAELARRAAAKQNKKKAYKELIPEVLPPIFEMLKEVSNTLSLVKKTAFEELKALIELKFEAYGVKSDQQSHTFTDENCSITIGYNIIPGYDDTFYMGVAKVKEFLKKQVRDDESAFFVDKLLRLLKMNKEGNLDPKRVLEIRQMADERNDADLLDGVQIIEEAYRPRRSSWYIKVSYKNGHGIDVYLPLSIASADFPAGFDLSFLLPEEKEEKEENN